MARPPTAEELSIAEAIAVALPKVLLEKEALSAAWDAGAPLARTLVVNTYAGEVEVTLRAPYAEAPSRQRPPFDVMADLFDLANDGEEIDHERRQELEDELVRKFVASSEARALTDVQSCHFVMDFAADYFSATLATLGPRELREIVFETSRARSASTPPRLGRSSRRIAHFTRSSSASTRSSRPMLVSASSEATP